jgi:CheY-like chemotaxis protein
MTKDNEETASNESETPIRSEREDKAKADPSVENAEPVATPRQSQQPPSSRGSVNPRKLDPTIVVAFVNLVPKIIGLLILLLIIYLYQDTIKEIAFRVSGAEAFGVKVSLSALVEKEKTRNIGRVINQRELKSAYCRAWNERSAFRDARILWVDDHPENNAIVERPILTSLGAQITVALSNKEAADFLRRGDYDLVITDMSRDAGNETGADIPKILDESIQAFAPPVIYYTMKEYRQVPGAFATATRPDELINYVTDALAMQECRQKNQTRQCK